MNIANLAYTPVAFDVPESGAKAIATGPLDWTKAAQYDVDTTQSNQLLEVQNIQAVFVDNSKSSGLLTIQVSATGHEVIIPGASQAWIQLIASDRPVISVLNSSGNGASKLWLVNFPVSTAIWNAA